MSKAKEIIVAFYAALARKDRQGLRQALTADFTYKGPMMAFDSPDAFVDTMFSMGMDGAPHGSRYIVEGDNVAHICTWRMTAPKRADIPVCEVFKLAGGRIAGIELYCDTKQMRPG